MLRGTSAPENPPSGPGTTGRCGAAGGANGRRLRERSPWRAAHGRTRARGGRAPSALSNPPTFVSFEPLRFACPSLRTLRSLREPLRQVAGVGARPTLGHPGVSSRGGPGTRVPGAGHGTGQAAEVRRRGLTTENVESTEGDRTIKRIRLRPARRDYAGQVPGMKGEGKGSRKALEGRPPCRPQGFSAKESKVEP